MKGESLPKGEIDDDAVDRAISAAAVRLGLTQKKPLKRSCPDVIADTIQMSTHQDMMDGMNSEPETLGPPLKPIVTRPTEEDDELPTPSERDGSPKD
ncbi:MAG: hypothetical protein BGO01_20415 [Armatimonadetes bacterium 55-13]|nr:MAG: hypothetical protein BGO01_20415 [Armatimonadetes bacterium 55-13]